MPVTDSPFTGRAAALVRQLALATQWGLQDVPYRAAPPAPPPEVESEFLALPAAQDLRFNLEPFADLLGHPGSKSAGLRGLPLRLVRGFFKFVMGPWLDVQTRFNRAVLQTLLHDQASSRQYLEQLAAHARHQQILLLNQQADTHGRLGQCEHGLATLRQAQRLAVRHAVQALERSLPGTTPGDGDSVSARAVEQVFLQTWLPRPPAQVLVIGGEAGEALNLATLGYQVVTDNGSALEQETKPAHVDAAFAAVVCLSRSCAVHKLFQGFYNVLRSGGRAVVTVPLADPVRQSPPNGFRLLETAYAVRAGHNWTYTTDAAVVESLQTRGPVAGVLMIAAEKN